jgi:hypothetical protein
VVEANTWPVLPKDTPIIYEDEEEDKMGEANRHANTNVILYACLKHFLKERHPQLRIYLNMSCYYANGPKHKKTGSLPYVSPDNMIVEPFEPSDDLVSYTIGKTGPEPRVTIESLSEGTAEVNDQDVKVKLYARLKVGEYILVDVTGEFLPEKLLLKRLQPDGTWKDERDADGGVTSDLGFRLLIDETDEVVVVDRATGKRYVRPDDIFQLEDQLLAEAHARELAEQKVREESVARKLEAKARKKAEAKALEEAEARKLAETKAREEAEARKMAESKAREQAEERLALQAELERLRSLLGEN